MPSLPNRTRQRLAVLATLTTFASGCGQAISDPSICPVVVPYTQADLNAAAEETHLLPEGSVIVEKMLPDYSVMREQARACR